MSQDFLSSRVRSLLALETDAPKFLEALDAVAAFQQNGRSRRGAADPGTAQGAGGVDGQEVVVRARRWRVRFRVVSSAATRASNAGAARGDRTADGA